MVHFIASCSRSCKAYAAACCVKLRNSETTRKSIFIITKIGNIHNRNCSELPIREPPVIQFSRSLSALLLLEGPLGSVWPSTTAPVKFQLIEIDEHSITTFPIQLIREVSTSPYHPNHQRNSYRVTTCRETTSEIPCSEIQETMAATMSSTKTLVVAHPRNSLQPLTTNRCLPLCNLLSPHQQACLGHLGERERRELSRR